MAKTTSKKKTAARPKTVETEEQVPSIEEQLKGMDLWQIMGRVGPGEEFARLRWVYGKGKRRRDHTVILAKSENPVPMEQIAKEIASIITPILYRNADKYPGLFVPRAKAKSKKHAKETNEHKEMD